MYVASPCEFDRLENKVYIIIIIMMHNKHYAAMHVLNRVLHLCRLCMMNFLQSFLAHLKANPNMGCSGNSFLRPWDILEKETQVAESHLQWDFTVPYTCLFFFHINLPYWSYVINQFNILIIIKHDLMFYFLQGYVSMGLILMWVFLAGHLF